MKIFKRFLPCFVIILAICALSFFKIEKESAVEAKSRFQYRPCVIIDAGHGGMDGGAVASDGTVEKNINLQIALKLKGFLSIYGYDVVMTRSSDTSTDNNPEHFNKKGDLDNRLKLMKNNPNAIFVSIHLNKFTTSAASGAQVFYSKNAEHSKQLGESIQQKIVEGLQPENKRVIKMNNNSTYILKNATVPSVIVECGFLSNKSELELLKNSDYQSKMAFCIAAGINEF